MVGFVFGRDLEFNEKTAVGEVCTVEETFL